MAYLNDDPVWEEGVRQLEETDDCEAEVFNGPLGQLAHRTKHLKQALAIEVADRQSSVQNEARERQEGIAEVIAALDALESAIQAILNAKAPIASPVFTGTPKAPNKTGAATNDGTLIASEAQVYFKADKNSPAFTGTPTAPTAATSVNSTQIATTAFVKAAITALVNSSPAALDTLQELAAALGNDPSFATTMTNALAGKAPASHASSAATYGAGSDANYGHVKLNTSTAPAMDGTAAVGASGKAADASHVHPTDTTRAPLASPALTGTPTAPTAATSVNSTQIATMAAAHAVAKNDAWPVGAFYTQYPLTGQSSLADMFPSSESPATLFGGTWTEMYADEKVFFMGGLSSVESNRSAGIQEDAIRNITAGWNSAFCSIGSASGALSISGEGVRPNSYSNSGYATNASIDASRVVPTDSTNHPRNRPIKVWRRTA
jgi:hypothetical protein